MVIERLLHEKKKLLESIRDLTCEIGHIVENSDGDKDIEEAAQRLEARGKLMEKINAIDKRVAMFKADSFEEADVIQEQKQAIQTLLREISREDSLHAKRLESKLAALSNKIREVNQGRKGIGAYVKNAYNENQSVEFDVKK